MNTSIKSNRFERHIDIRQGGVNALDWLVSQSMLNKSTAELAVSTGAVWLTRGSTSRLRDCRQVLKYGDQLHVYYDAEIINMQPLEPTLILETEAYSIWFKPQGMRGEGTRFGDHCSLARWVEKHYQGERSVDFIYRLDSTISGLMLISHDQVATEALQQQFLQKQLRIDYRAWLDGLPRFNHEVLDFPVRGKSAKTLVTTLKQHQDVEQSLVAIRLETGRKHQIRQHLSAKGYPVLGDRLYGNSREEGLQLQVVELHFICPLSGSWQHIFLPEALRIDLEPPAKLQDYSATGS